MVKITNTNIASLPPSPTSPRPVIYQSPKVPPRRTPPQTPSPIPKSNKPLFSESDFLEDSSSLQQDGLRKEESTAHEETSPSEKDASSVTNPPQPSSALRPLSKIPTPLPRKTVNFKTSPPASPTSSEAASAISNPQSKLPTVKARVSSQKSLNPVTPEEREKNEANDSTAPTLSPENEHRESPKSQIPVSIPPQTSLSPPAVTIRQKPSAEKRLTVVEVCEKVLVPQGEASVSPPVTPFITVARVRDNDTNHDQVRIDEKNSTAFKKC